MKAKLLFSGALLSALVAPAAGCGSLDGHTGTPEPLATLQGSLTVQSGVSVGSDVHVAVVWYPDVCNTAGNIVVEDLPVQPVFPSNFSVQLTSPPPASTVRPIPGVDGTVAIGFVVAYEDLNGNGKLDFVPSDATQFIDKIVGFNADTYIMYFAGALPPDSAGPGPSVGYNVAVDTCLAGVDAGTCSSQFFPMSAPYDLTLTEDLGPDVSGSIMCVGYTRAAGSGGPGTAGAGSWNIATQGPPSWGYPLPGDPGLHCAGTTSYSYSGCKTYTLCGSTDECGHPGNVALGGAAPPPGWPCP